MCIQHFHFWFSTLLFLKQYFFLHNVESLMTMHNFRNIIRRMTFYNITIIYCYQQAFVWRSTHYFDYCAHPSFSLNLILFYEIIKQNNSITKWNIFAMDKIELCYLSWQIDLKFRHFIEQFVILFFLVKNFGFK